MSRPRPLQAKPLAILALVVTLAPFTLGTSYVPGRLQFAIEGTLIRPPGATGQLFVTLVGRCGAESGDYTPLTYQPWGGQTDDDPVVLAGAEGGPNAFTVSATSECMPDSVAVAVAAPGREMVLSDPIGFDELESDSVFADAVPRFEPAGCGYFRKGESVRYVAALEWRTSKPLSVPVPY